MKERLAMSRLKMEKSRIIAFIVIVFMVGLVFGDKVSAASTAGGWIGTGSGQVSGGGGGGSGCDSTSLKYREDCAGASWMFFEAKTRTDTDTVVGAPFTYLLNNSSTRAVIPAVCSQHIEDGEREGIPTGFWHYGPNAQGSQSGLFSVVNSNNSSLYSTSSGMWGHWGTAGYGSWSWMSSSLMNSLKSNVQHNIYGTDSNGNWSVIYSATQTKTAADIASEYEQACIGAGGSDCGSGIPKGTWGFCYWPGIGGGEDPKYYAQSNASANLAGDGSNGYVTTDVVAVGDTKQATTNRLKVEPGQEVTLVFSHNVFGNTENSEATWRVERMANNSLNFTGSDYTISGSSTGSYTGTTKVTLGTRENGYYYANGRTAESGGAYYNLRDVYTVKFTTQNKTHTFCENLYVNGNSGATTKVCAVVEVGGTTPPPSGGGGGGGDSSQLCSTWAPASYRNSYAYYGVTSAVSRVINNRLTRTYSGWRGTIDEGTNPGRAASLDSRITYAKPGDTLRWVNCYWPGVQKVYNTYRTYTHGAHGSYNTSNTNYVESSAVFGAWENRYSIKNESDTSWFNGANPVGEDNLGTGMSTTKMSGNTYTVKRANDTGKYFQETITGGNTPVYVQITNEGIHSWSCRCKQCTCSCGRNCSRPCCCSCWHTNNYYRLDARQTGPVVSGAARVEVPYNFNNTAGVSLDRELVYAGETVKVENPWVKIGVKANAVTEATYATQVDNAQVRMMVYVTNEANANKGARTISGNAGSEACNLISEDSQCLTVKRKDNANLNMTGDVNTDRLYTNSITSNNSTTTFNGVYNVFDAKAGDYFCVAMAVYPATSGGDKNLDKNGDYKWYVSQPACAVIAKRPMVQILGSGIFSAGDIETSTSEKTNVYGVSGLSYTVGNAQSLNNRRIFGSWVEQAVVANGRVNLASGAATGLQYVGDVLVGGSHEGGSVSFCNYRTPLSFANTSSPVASGICSGQNYVGLMGVSISTVNRQALVDYFAVGTQQSNGNGVSGFSGTFERKASGTGRTIMYSENASSTNSEVRVGDNTTIVVKVDGDMRINNNIYYGNGVGAYNSTRYRYATVPKVVIYASNNIHIGCDVGTVDAMLIAGGTVYTCGDYSATDSRTWNDRARSGQLRINGVVVANSIEFSRTYGNTMGTGSGTPAEIINYDSSAIVWGRSMADAAESDTLTTVYQHELAPRY